MSSNSGDNWDLISSVPGDTGPLPKHPGFDIANEGALMSRIRNFYDEGVGAWEENRRMHSEDLNFIYNSEAMGQWDPVVLQNRRGKPCYTFNRCIGAVNVVIGDMAQSRPDGKVRPASDGASQPVADIFEGLCRSIEQASRFDSIAKEQYKYAVAGGFGAWRIMPTYMTDRGDGAFDQVLRLINIANPQTVVWDPQCADPCAGDANRCIVAERISDEVYQALYKDENGVSFTMSRDSYGWFTDKEVRIAEYFERVPREKWIAKMTDGSVQEYTADLKATEAYFDEQGITAAQHGTVRVARDSNDKPMVRKTIHWQVMWCKIDGSNILEGPYYYDWKRIPVVRVPGRYINIEGRKKFQSYIRHAKDAQRSYNSRASDMIERSALIPKAPYLVTETMIRGFENEWNQANVASRPYLPYNIDPKAQNGGMPYRMEPLDLPQGAIALAQMSIEDIKATLGSYDATLGNADDMNRVSGKALVQHNRRSDLGTYEFVDGFGQALQLSWEMMIDMIPQHYDTHRIERIIGKDGMEKMVAINIPHTDEFGNDKILNELAAGQYDVEVTVGPSHATARQEALDTLLGLAEVLPTVAPMIGDLIAKNVDISDATELARRLRIPLIQQGLIQPTEGEKAQGIPQKSPAQQAQEQMAQLEQQLLQAKTTKMGADAQIAQSKAQAAGDEQAKLKAVVQGHQLGNIKLQQEIQGNPQDLQAQHASNMMDLAAKHAGNQQDLAHAEQKHRQSMLHTHQSHVADTLKDRAEAAHGTAIDHHDAMADERREHEKYEREEARKQRTHEAEMRRMEEKHEKELSHATKLNEAKVSAAKAMAKAKPKPAKA